MAQIVLDNRETQKYNSLMTIRLNRNLRYNISYAQTH